MSFSTLETEIRDFDNQLQPSLQRGRAGNTVGARSQTSTFLRTEWQEKEQKKKREFPILGIRTDDGAVWMVGGLVERLGLASF